jgi:16S rRNA (guanine966-N2)-methyltransferase
MRVIAGIYRGRSLKSPPDLRTRPTSDRLRETLFNILNPQITDETIFLDLCAGTGAIGIEAISRGAKYVTFVELARRNCAIIEENLDNLQIPETQTEIICEKADKFLSKCEKTFDIVYFDPPYRENYRQILHQFGEENSRLLNEDGVVIAEHSVKGDLPDLTGELRRWRLLKQGDSALSFYERR